jgi:hypothetical protein
MVAYRLKKVLEVLKEKVDPFNDPLWLIVTDMNEINDNIDSFNDTLRLLPSIFKGYFLATQKDGIALAKIPNKHSPLFTKPGERTVEVNVEDYAELSGDYAFYHNEHFKAYDALHTDVVIGNIDSIVKLNKESSDIIDLLLGVLSEQKIKRYPNSIGTSFNFPINLDETLGLDPSESPQKTDFSFEDE